MLPSTVDLVVRDARVVTPEGTRRGGVAVDDGVIVAVAADPTLPRGDQEVDAEGNYLIPGLIDPHVHLGRRGTGYPEQLVVDFETETRGALFGGVTSLLNFVEQGGHYVPDLDVFIEVGEANSYIDFGYHMVMSHAHHIDEIPALAERGMTSYKMFFNMYKYSDIDIEPCEADRVYRVLAQVAEIPGAVGMFHAENAELQRECERQVRAAGRHDLRAWADASPPAAEAMQIDQIGHLSSLADARCYVVHVSSAEGVAAVTRARDRGADVVGETLVTFLANTVEDDLGVWGKVSPPLRGPRHQKALWEAVRVGTIDHIGTDHVAMTVEEQDLGEGRYGEHFWDAPPGIQPGMEFMLPMLLTEGYNRNRLSMERLVEVCSTNNAKRFGLYPRKGAIAVGSDADLVVVDPDRETTVDDDFFHTREPRWSSVHGRDVKGMATHTIVGGDLAVADRTLLADPGGGRFLARGPAGERAL
ncbi:dihydroorotase [Salinigranum halophilum]|uniref:dihydroorotase n=1 Tax=Salinigranum halophilum TaxID=2565931 RepID=UPI0010A8ABA7|nr:amidohydrolase family protein [Salinigranum halophilum]